MGMKQQFNTAIPELLHTIRLHIMYKGVETMNSMNQKRSRRYTILISLLAAFMVILAGCGSKPAAVPAPTPEPAPAESTTGTGEIPHPIATIEMDSGKVIKLELYPEVAPNTVNNFISLANQGFYDGLIFHRVIPGFMIQGGDPEGLGTGGPGYSIKGEFATNGFDNTLKHTTGVISMARSQSLDSAGSQFFIMTADASHLDGQYAAFGKVTEGLDVVEEIVNLPRGAKDRPTDPPVMKKVTIDTLGKEYPEPVKVQ